MSKIKLDYVQRFVDRHGRARFYFRRTGSKRVPLPGLPGSEEFMQAYRAALAGQSPPPPIGATRAKVGTMAALIASYFASSEFLKLEETTKSTYRGIIEGIRREHGDKPVDGITRGHIDAMLAKKIKTPAAGNNWLRMMRMLMKFAVAENMIATDPTATVKSIKVGSTGFHTWSEEDIEKFENHYAVGTKQRLAMALMLYTGCRRSDVVLLGRQQIKNGFLTYTQRKNKKRKPVTLTIPVHPTLQRVIDGTPSDHLTFLTTSFGKPFSAAGFGNWFRDVCNDARLPDCSSHGLRKAISRRLAEAGMSPHQIQAITGHATLKEVERYTRAASQKLMAEMAMQALSGAGEVSEPVLIEDQRERKA